MNLLFQAGVACETYKHPKHTCNFKNKVLSALKARYERVTGPGSHSSSRTRMIMRTCQCWMSYVFGFLWSIKRWWIFRRLYDATIGMARFSFGY
jgi:hypothetical protein